MKNRKTYQTYSPSFVLLAIVFGSHCSLFACHEEYKFTTDQADFFGEATLKKDNSPDQEVINLLFDAIKADDLPALEKLINEKGADVNTESRRHKLSPLAFAIKIDASYEITSLLLKKEACLDTINFASLSPYMRAFVDVFSGNFNGVRSVIRSTADCEQAEKEGLFILHAAAYTGNSNLVKFLVDRGFSVHKQNTTGQTPVFFAAFAGHKDIVECLIERGAELNTRDGFGHTVLETACFHGHQHVVRTLLGYGSLLDFGPNERKLHPLFIAASSGNKDLVEDFILLREDINQPSNYGRRPLHAAALGGHLEVVELLVSYRAEIDSIDAFGNTPLHYAAQQNLCEVISCLVKHGANFSQKNKQGKTPLDYILDFRHDVRTALRRKLPENCVLEICRSIPLDYIPSEHDQAEDQEEGEVVNDERPAKRPRIA